MTSDRRIGGGKRISQCKLDVVIIREIEVSATSMDHVVVLMD